MTTHPIAITAAVIIAGGLSRRMFADQPGGLVRDKALLDLGRETMLARVIGRLAPQVETLLINANGAPDRFAKFGLPVIADPIEGHVGPLAGVLAGMRWATAHDDRTTHIVTVSSDVPFLPRDFVARLAAIAEKSPNSIVLAASGDEIHAVIGCWPVRLAGDLEKFLQSGGRKVKAWAESHGVAIVHFESETVGRATVDPFFNANTPVELEEARRIIAREHDAS